MKYLEISWSDLRHHGGRMWQTVLGLCNYAMVCPRSHGILATFRPTVASDRHDFLRNPRGECSVTAHVAEGCISWLLQLCCPSTFVFTPVLGLKRVQNQTLQVWKASCEASARDTGKWGLVMTNKRAWIFSMCSLYFFIVSVSLYNYVHFIKFHLTFLALLGLWRSLTWRRLSPACFQKGATAVLPQSTGAFHEALWSPFMFPFHQNIVECVHRIYIYI